MVQRYTREIWQAATRCDTLYEARYVRYGTERHVTYDMKTREIRYRARHVTYGTKTRAIPNIAQSVTKKSSAAAF